MNPVVAFPISVAEIADEGDATGVAVSVEDVIKAEFAMLAFHDT